MTAPALDLRQISVHYGFVRALDGVSLRVESGQTVALLGDNGAGKSTLLKVMSGAHRPSGGEIRVGGDRVEFHSPADAVRAGIEMVYQDLALVDALDASVNLTLGREPLRRGPLGWLGFVDKRRMRVQASEEVARLGVKISSLTRPVEMLSGGQRQGIALARAAVRVAGERGGVLLMDEPTAALGYEQKLMVRRLIENLNEQGVAIVLVTHDLPLAFECADRMAVLNRGRKVAEVATADTDNDAIVGWITGARVAQSDG
ncbi:MAG: ATP-binding cassette domain-containing protein [Microbacterium sp.]|uniref:ATP-binding cassette domain-containing protein n=1 Tax=Microbacterium sp. TaxID=51671 RepID=UPI0039E3CD5B